MMETKKILIEGITQDIIKYLCEDNNITIEEAMDMVYNSDVFERLSNENTGLYRESSSYIYELLKDELADGKIIQKEY